MSDTAERAKQLRDELYALHERLEEQIRDVRGLCLDAQAMVLYLETHDPSAVPVPQSLRA